MSQKKKLTKILGDPIGREEAMGILRTDLVAYHQFLDFPPEYQERVLEFIHGTKNTHHSGYSKRRFTND